MVAVLEQYTGVAHESALLQSNHLLFVLPPIRPAELPFAPMLDAKLERTRTQYADWLSNLSAQSCRTGRSPLGRWWMRP